MSHRLRGRAPALAFIAVIALAAVNFLWQLGSSSYFVDEIISFAVSGHRLGGLLHAISHLEITPPAYFLFEHEWLARSGSKSEWVLRLPSAVAAIGLVATVYWLTWRLNAGRWVALGAATGAAISPLILQYAQLAQGYVFAALGTTLALAAGLQASRAREPRQGSRWLWLSALTGAAALATNYTAALVLAPLCAWVWHHPKFPVRWRRLYVGGVALLGAVLAPLFIAQWRAEPGRHGVGHAADLSVLNVVRLIEAPFAGRVGPLPVLGMAVMSLGLGSLLRRWRTLDGGPRLVAVIAIGEPLALIVLSAFGARVAITRYAVVAAPVMLVALALGLRAMPRPAAGVIATGAVLVSLAGVLGSHRSSGFYADTRGAVSYVEQHRRPGEPVLAPPAPGLTVPLSFYATTRQPRLSLAKAPQSSFDALRARGRPVWVIDPLSSPIPTATRLLAFERSALRPLGFAPVSVQVLPGLTPLAVSLWKPLPSRAR